MSEEHAPPPPVYSPSDRPDGEVEISDEKKQETTLPRNPFVYGGAIPAGVRPKNVVLFGETGAGKSSVVNLMAGAEVAKTSPNLRGCTLQAVEHSFTLDGEASFRIYDTVGLNEPQMSATTFLVAVEKAYGLISSLHDTGGIDLLLFCIRGNRITATLQNNYRLFFEFIGEKKIPLALVVTYLEYEDVMEDWWERNEQTFQEYGIHSIAHACITGVAARVTMHAKKREESKQALQRMLHHAFSSTSSPHAKDTQSWLTSVIGFLRSLLMKNSSFRKKDLLKRLEIRCGFSREDAQKLVEVFTKGR